MENLILRVLSFDLTVPTHFTFLMEYCISNNLSDKIKFLAMVGFTKYKYNLCSNFFIIILSVLIVFVSLSFIIFECILHFAVFV